MQKIITNLSRLAKDKYKENNIFFNKLRNKPIKHLDYLMKELHENEFNRTDCLSCANCCKTTGPLFTDKDIQRISKFFKIKESQFIKQYLILDEENDYVLRNLPCSFLGNDNYCQIYDVRPKACREFPHTKRKKFHKISNLTLKNITICPAAYNIVEAMKKRI